MAIPSPTELNVSELIEDLKEHVKSYRVFKLSDQKYPYVIFKGSIEEHSFDADAAPPLKVLEGKESSRLKNGGGKREGEGRKRKVDGLRLASKWRLACLQCIKKWISASPNNTALIHEDNKSWTRTLIIAAAALFIAGKAQFTSFFVPRH